MKPGLLLIMVFIMLPLGLSAQTNMPIDSIGVIFNKVKQICDKDNGKLWGQSLYSSILVIDRTTKSIVANEPDFNGLLVKNKTVFTGKFPETSIIANSTTRFGDKFWTMVGYPLPNDEFSTNLLFVHELFHQLQSKIGLGGNGFDNSHMDNFQARIYLKLEWLALLKAFNSKEKDTGAISDALLFRNYRRSLFPGADSMENKFEIGEGLADYTADKLCSDSVAITKTVNSKREAFWPINVRAFGYYSGLLYACLLDKYDLHWKVNLKYNDNLGDKLGKALNIVLPPNILQQVEKRKINYGYDSIYTYELALKREKDNVLSYYRNIFINNPTVKFNLRNPRYGFNPNSLQPVDSIGTVFHYIKLVDDWGILTVQEGGCLISKDWKAAFVPAVDLKISENSIIGKGWTLTLNEKWEAVKSGDSYLIRKISVP